MGKRDFSKGKGWHLCFLWMAFIGVVNVAAVALSVYFGTMATSSGREAFAAGETDDADYSLRCYLDEAGALIPQGWVDGYDENFPDTGTSFYSSGVSLSRFDEDYEEGLWQFPTSEDETADPYQRINGIFNLYGYLPGFPEYGNKPFGWDLSAFDWVFGGLPSAEGQIAIPSYAYDILIERETADGAIDPTAAASSLTITLDESIEYSICGVFVSDPNPAISEALLKLKLMPSERTAGRSLTDEEVCAFLFPDAAAFVYSPVFNLGKHHHGVSIPLIPVNEKNANATLEENGLIFSTLPYAFILDDGYEDLSSSWNSESTYSLDQNDGEKYDAQSILFIVFAAVSAAVSAVALPLSFLLSKRRFELKSLAWSLGSLVCSFALGAGIGVLAAYLQQANFFDRVILAGLPWLKFGFSTFWPLLLALGLSFLTLFAVFFIKHIIFQNTSESGNASQMD